MGPGRAMEVIREGLFRGADDGVLLTVSFRRRRHWLPPTQYLWQ